MKAAPVVILNFHHMSEEIAETLGLDEQRRTPEEMQAKERERAQAQNPHIQRNKADTGVPALGRYGEARLQIKDMVQDLLLAGFKLVDAYKQDKFKTVNGVVTSEKVGTLARFVFSTTGAEPNFEKPEEASEYLSELLKGLDGFVAPVVHVWHNSDDKNERTTDTVNVATLSKKDERGTLSVSALRYTAGVFTVQRSRTDRYHQPNERW